MFNLIPLPYRILGALLIVASLIGGSVYYGYHKAELKYIAKIAKMEADSDVLQAKLDASLSEVKVEVLTKYFDRVKVVKEKEYVYIEQAASVVPNQFQLSSGWVYLHDTVATGSDADPTRSADGTPSGIEDNQALGIITENYGICKQNAEQLESLQEWVREAQATVEKSNEEAKRRSKKK
jgi:hypothetical protein